MDIPLLNVQNISKNIKITKMLFLKKNINILNAINFELNQAETLVIMGENGSGKSTFLKIFFMHFDDFWRKKTLEIIFNSFSLANNSASSKNH